MILVFGQSVSGGSSRCQATEMREWPNNRTISVDLVLNAILEDPRDISRRLVYADELLGKE